MLLLLLLEMHLLKKKSMNLRTKVSYLFWVEETQMPAWVGGERGRSVPSKEDKSTPHPKARSCRWMDQERNFTSHPDAQRACLSIFH